jgi:hypothetical protein
VQYASMPSPPPLPRDRSPTQQHKYHLLINHSSHTPPQSIIQALEPTAAESRPASALLHPLLDRCRPELLKTTTTPMGKRPRPGSDAPMPPSAPSPQLPSKIATLTTRLVEGVKAVGAVRAGHKEGGEGEEDREEGQERLVVALAGALTHYVAGILLPSGPSSPPASAPVPPPLAPLQRLGGNVASWLRGGGVVTWSPTWPRAIRDGLIELLAALLAAERAASGGAAPASRLPLAEQVAEDVSTVGERCVNRWRGGGRGGPGGRRVGEREGGHSSMLANSCLASRPHRRFTFLERLTSLTPGGAR